MESSPGREESFFLFGVNPVREKLRASPKEVFEVLLVKEQMRPALRLIEVEAKGRGLAVRYVGPALLDRLSAGQRHQGVAARVAAYVYQPFEQLLEELPPSAGRDLILFLDGITDPGNFGALLRSAEGAGVRHVVVPKDRSVGVSPAVAKASAGAVHYLRISRVPNLRRALIDLKERGYWVVGLDEEARESIYQRLYPDKLVVVLGAEDTGIRPLVKRECDFLAAIPMRGKISSLNVAVAGAIFLYEILRQGKA